MRLLDFEETKEICYDAFEYYLERYEADLLAYVLMSNHIHFVIFFREQNKLSEFMRDFKKWTARHIRDWLLANRPDLHRRVKSSLPGQQYQLWDNRYDAFHLYSRKVTKVKIDYIHKNPIRSGLCQSESAYAHSSAPYLLVNHPIRLTVRHYQDAIPRYDPKNSKSQ